jgi:tRNA pseudouridine13 synthase
MPQTEVNAALEPSANAHTASIKTFAEDWRVTEVMDQSWSGEGEHAYVYVEKRGLNTAQVATWLAQQYAVKEMNIGYCGMKDKYAVTQQWFSVHSPLDINPVELTLADASEANADYAKVLQSTRHNKKLRRGEHALNHFGITLRDLDPCAVLDESSLAALGLPFANYFGPQRFGINNIESALSWLKNRRSRKISRAARGWHFSVLRSLLFNKILRARVLAGNWHTFIDGDAKEFAVPSGSLWGRGRTALTADALALETQALAEDAWVCEALEFAGVDRGMRALSVQPKDFNYTNSADGALVLNFALPPGAYATVLLAEHFDIKDNSR